MVHNVSDIAVDGNMEVFITPAGDLGAVRGREAFEQRLRVRLTARADELIGEYDEENIIDLLESAAQRVAANMDELEAVAYYNVDVTGDALNTFEVQIVYDSGDDLTFNVP